MTIRLPLAALLPAALLPLAVGLGACATAATSTAAPTATASLAAGDMSARGSATITQASDGLHVAVRAQGLTPGVHAVHIHTTGKCDGPAFTTAGGHWNPTNNQHGKDNPAGQHMGDMPNMTVASDGTGAMDYHVAGGMLSSGATPLFDADGAAIVIHAVADDYKSDPAGNAGGRVACGVLKQG